MPERIERADSFFSRIGANVRHGGNQAFYAPATDHIQMPPFGAFTDSLSYYSTLAHEHTHWSAKAGRCDRQLGKRFADHAYAAEELIAELGAAFTCAHLGLSTEPREDHAQYLNSWLKVLKADSRAIFTAASKAQQATTWRMPWHTTGRYAFSPINVASKKAYRGINTVCLWASAQAKGYERGEWATYQQWQDKGAQVRKGEKSTLVVFWKFANDSSETQEGETSRPPETR